MQAGKLRHNIQWLTPDELIKGPFGEVGTGPPTQVGATHGSIEPLRGMELWQARQIQAETTHRIRVRWKPTLAITAKMIAQYQGRQFQILEVLNREERNRELEILAKEVIA